MAPKRKFPYEVAASAMVHKDFELFHPFVKVRSGLVPKVDFNISETPEGKIARVNGVDKELLNYFMKEHLFLVMQKSANCYRVKSTENKFRALVSCFFPIFTHLAPQASDATLLKQHEQGVPSDDAVEELCVINKASSSTAHDMIYNGDSQQELNFVEEDGANMRPQQAVDFQGYTFGGYAFGVQGRRHRFTLLIADAKQSNFLWDVEVEEDSVLYQLGEYACCAAVANVKQGRLKPVHILVIADGIYGIACLEVEGYLTVDEEGKITDGSFAEFLQKSEQCKSGVAHKTSSKTELRASYQNKLNTSRRDMRRKGLNDSVPVGSPLLVGEIVYYPLKRSWTTFPIVADQIFSSEDYVFIAALLRILYGDRVLLWTRSTLEALAQAHDAKLNALGSLLLRLQ